MLAMNAPGHLTYSDLCADPDSCPLTVDEILVCGITNYFTGWNTTVPPVLDGTALQEEVLVDMGAEITGGIVVMVADSSLGGVLQIIHSIHKEFLRTLRVLLRL